MEFTRLTCIDITFQHQKMTMPNLQITIARRPTPTAVPPPQQQPQQQQRPRQQQQSTATTTTTTELEAVAVNFRVDMFLTQPSAISLERYIFHHLRPQLEEIAYASGRTLSWSDKLAYRMQVYFSKFHNLNAEGLESVTGPSANWEDDVIKTYVCGVRVIGRQNNQIVLSVADPSAAILNWHDYLNSETPSMPQKFKDMAFEPCITIAYISRNEVNGGGNKLTSESFAHVNMTPANNALTTRIDFGSWKYRAF